MKEIPLISVLAKTHYRYRSFLSAATHGRILKKMSFGEASLNLLIILSLCQGGNSDCSHLGDHGFECQDKNHSCVLIYHVCDGEADCPDGSDELWYDNMTSTQKERGFRCPSGCYLPKEYVCDQYNHCNEDECNCGYSNPIRCSKDGACINENFFCDGYGGACPNNEDELLYHESMKGRNEYLKCWAGKLQGACALLYERHKCDGIKDCVHGGDECFCKDNDTNGQIYKMKSEYSTWKYSMISLSIQ